MKTILWLTLLSLMAMSYDQPAVEASPSPGHHGDHDEDEDEDEIEQCKKVEEKVSVAGGCPCQKIHDIIVKYHKQLVNKYQELKTNVKPSNLANKPKFDDVTVAKLLTKGQEIYKGMKLWS